MEVDMKKFIIFFTIILTIVFNSASYVAAVQKTWENPKHLNTYIQPGLGRSTMMKHAFAEWSRLTKNKVVFYYVNDPNKADIEARFVDILPGLPSGVAGLTNIKYNQQHMMLKAVIYIPLKTSGGMTLSKDGVYTSMLHEIGHAIGIADHSKNPQNIMYPVIDVKREITIYDLGELYRTYGWKWDR